MLVTLAIMVHTLATMSTAALSFSETLCDEMNGCDQDNIDPVIADGLDQRLDHGDRNRHPFTGLGRDDDLAGFVATAVDEQPALDLLSGNSEMQAGGTYAPLQLIEQVFMPFQCQTR